MEKYQFKIDDREVFIDNDGPEKDWLHFPSEKVFDDIKVRIKYEGFEEWSKWISPEQPVSTEMKSYKVISSHRVLDQRLSHVWHM